MSLQVGEVEGLLEEAKDLIDQIEVESLAATGDARKQVRFTPTLTVCPLQ